MTTSQTEEAEMREPEAGASTWSIAGASRDLAAAHFGLIFGQGWDADQLERALVERVMSADFYESIIQLARMASEGGPLNSREIAAQHEGTLARVEAVSTRDFRRAVASAFKLFPRKFAEFVRSPKFVRSPHEVVRMDEWTTSVRSHLLATAAYWALCYIEETGRDHFTDVECRTFVELFVKRARASHLGLLQIEVKLQEAELADVSWDEPCDEQPPASADVDTTNIDEERRAVAEALARALD